MRSLVLLGAFILLSSTAMAAEPGTVVVGEISGEAEVTPSGGSAHPLLPGEKILEQDRIYTGFDSKVELKFSDGTVVVVQELTDMMVGSFRTGEGQAKTRLWLRAGELDAKVKPSSAGKNDFHIKTPTTTCSVRGTNPIVTTALGFTSVSFITGYGGVSDDPSGARTDTSAGQQAQNDDAEDLSSSSDLARDDSQGADGVNGLTAAERNSSSSSLLPGDTVVARGDIAGSSAGTGGSFQTFSEGATADALTPPPTVRAERVPQTITARNSVPEVIDFGEITRIFSIAPSALHDGPNSVKDVNISVSFTKASQTGSSPRFDRIEMFLTNPDGIGVKLVDLGTYSAGADPFQGTVSFDQSSPLAINASPDAVPIEAIFQPVGSLDALNGGVVVGDWKLGIGNRDSTGTTPLRFDGAVLQVTH